MSIVNILRMGWFYHVQKHSIIWKAYNILGKIARLVERTAIHPSLAIDEADKYVPPI